MPKLVTLARHILDTQRMFPRATGAFSDLLTDIALSAKMIAKQTTRAGLVDILGASGTVNVQGEVQQKLDEYANLTIFQMNDHTGRLCVMASEEDESIIQIPEEYPRGKYVLAYDPLDGSTNIDSNGAVGTIFGVFRRVSPGDGTHGTVSDLLQPARKLVAAGYVIYGPSTMLVYSTGFGVHGFTLDPSVGEFILSHENMKLPDKPRYYAANQGWQKFWTPGTRRYVEWLQALDGSDRAPLGLRYSGTMIADFHRNLLNGGVYFYPVEEKDGKRNSGKIRLLYEAGPLAYLIEQAGGYASDGRQNILDIQPFDLHQRVPFFVGSRELVRQAERFLAEEHVIA